MESGTFLEREVFMKTGFSKLFKEFSSHRWRKGIWGLSYGLEKAWRYKKY
jgi:hypothetical protein